MDISALEEILKKEPNYRIKQVKKALFSDLIESWQAISVLPLSLRKELEEKCPLEINSEAVFSKDKKTIKVLITLKDGLAVESVLMRHQDKRNTVCLSSQIGCSVGCLFCATGQMGFKRNLSAQEIIEQALYFARYLKKENAKISNIVFMGMGEPFLNYSEVLKAIEILNDENSFGLGARRISISTVGITEGIIQLAKDQPQINLAVSLHAPNDELRTKLVPVGKKYTIEKIMTALDYYIKKTNRRVMFEYLMLEGINDDLKLAEDLTKIVKRPLCFVNLISYNPAGNFKASSNERIKKFQEVLEKNGVVVTVRYRFGKEIKGACGQLAGR
jgi:23S rRNA (adenine2503-C2)-methyltransferase